MPNPNPHLRSLELLRKATTPKGILASITDETNYRRIWARDSVICGLAGLVAQDATITEGLKASLTALAEAQGPHGEIPSNVQFGEDGKQQSLSFGGLCGRVDTIGWWIVGLGNYVQFSGDTAFAENYREQVSKGLTLLKIWEFNGRGLVYVPQSGDWADEYILRGYILYDQLLRLWALQLAAKVYNEPQWTEEAQALRKTLELNYWLDDRSGDFYHEHAYQLSRRQRGDSQYWEASFSPGGYVRKFDLLANSLAILLHLGDDQQNQQILTYTNAVQSERPFGLMPSFWPPIFEGDQEWYLLEANHKYQFRNQAYDFHNGGLWPAFNGLWGTALLALQQTNTAENLLKGIEQSLEAGDWGFYECLHGQSGAVSGTPYCSWSAAGQVMLECALNGQNLFFDNPTN